MAERNLILTKESTSNEIKSYFSAILELSKSDNEFPINLDEVWMLVYTEKGKAVRALKENFIEGVDFKVSPKYGEQVFAQNGKNLEGVDYRCFAQNGKNPNGGRPTVDYYLTVSCLEFFIARKVRPVFEVYRQVFHGAAKMVQKELSRKELLQLALEAEEEKERLQLVINEQQSVIDRQAPDVAFAQTIKASGTNILIGDFAKVLASNNYIIGQNRLFEWLRANKFLDERNVPMQRYLEMGLFVIEEKPVAYHSDGRAIVRITPRITPKGQEYIITRLNDGRLYIPRKIKTA